MTFGQKVASWQKLLDLPYLRRVLVAAILFWAIGCVLVLQRYYNFYPTYVSFDQGIFNQVFWNNLHGRWFEGSLSSTESVAVIQGDVPDVAYHRLGQHFTPALLLWLPWYALFPSPSGLSVLQVTLVAIAGLVLYALARHYHPPQLSAWIAVSYYAAIAVISPTLANFHDICQIPLYIFGLLLALEKRQWWLVGVLAVLTLLVREDSGVVLFGVGFYLLVSRRFPWLGVGLCALSLGYMLAVTNLIMPLFSTDVSQRFMIEEFGQFVDGDEASTLDVLIGILTNPRRLIIEVVTPFDRTLRYLLGQWVPLAFVTVISPSAWALAGFPTLKILIQQQDITALSLHLRYAMTLVPGLFYGAILWWSTHTQWFDRRVRRVWAICIILSLFFTITANPNRTLSWLIPDSFRPWVYVSPPRQWQHSQAIRSLLAQIPPGASVTATDHIVAHVSNRREVLRFPRLRLRNDQNKTVRMQYAIADLWYLQQYEPAFADYRQSLVVAIEQVDRILDRQYGLIALNDGVLLLQDKTPSNPEVLNNWLTYRQELQQAIEAHLNATSDRS
ncbi:DUF2079 domain-containing protein [Thermocoleostomius sinensis]|uniref:DUF2079 domain-containing protein n=1 Tax=Thermocoleostomius sinensis A174 TaxID=2016057 RepID=A0A9E9C9J2_9CYAN|nr:DUF2079 domain-containing protein [Thermocoleostomius sinensis]WAL59657.1 DUF2079 domain-containing protein [Thermocoleostomius sinensis A174]